MDALLWGEAWDVSMNDLLTGVPRPGLEEGSQQLLATTLMGYARSNPDRIRGRLMPVIVYDPQAGRRAYTVAMEKLAQSVNCYLELQLLSARPGDWSARRRHRPLDAVALDLALIGLRRRR